MFHCSIFSTNKTNCFVYLSWCSTVPPHHHRLLYRTGIRVRTTYSCKTYVCKIIQILRHLLKQISRGYSMPYASNDREFIYLLFKACCSSIYRMLRWTNIEIPVTSKIPKRNSNERLPQKRRHLRRKKDFFAK